MVKTTIKKFLGMEVRIVNEEYLILKDMFSALDNNNKLIKNK